MSLTELTSLSQGEPQKKPLRRTEIRAVLKRHNGSIARIAEELHVSSVTVSRVLLGKNNSRRVSRAAEAKALQLLEQEKQEQDAATTR